MHRKTAIPRLGTRMHLSLPQQDPVLLQLVFFQMEPALTARSGCAAQRDWTFIAMEEAQITEAEGMD